MLLALGSAGPVAAQDDELREQMQAIVDDLNDNSFRKFHAAIEQRRMLNRITSHYPIDPQVTAQLQEQFEEAIEGEFRQSFPVVAGSEIIGQLIDVNMNGNTGDALVRFRLPNYRFDYIRFDLGLNRRNRLIIDDWFNYLRAEQFSESIAQDMVAALPSQGALRGLVPGVNLDANDMFLVREIAKAARDNGFDRVFEIVGQMKPELMRHSYVVDLRIRAAQALNDTQRFDNAMRDRIALSANDSDYALQIAEYHLQNQNFEESLAAMQVFLQGLGVEDGAALSRMSALALASDNHTAAEDYAARATAAEPQLKLGWWSLLRARARVDDFAGSVEVLTRLEDDFGDRFDAAKLKRDRYGAFHKLAESDEFEDWRSGR